MSRQKNFKFTGFPRIVFILNCYILLAVNAHVLDEVPLVDGHNDLPYNLYKLLQNNLDTFKFEANLTNDPVWGLEACSSCYTDLPRLRRGKVGAQFWVAYVSCDVQYKDALAKTIEQIDVIKRLAKKYSNDLELVTTAAGIRAAFQNKKIASLIAVEGGHSMDSRLGVLRMLYDLGVRYMTLTHSCNTPWYVIQSVHVSRATMGISVIIGAARADNSYVDDTTPVHNLTAFGKMVVQEMNRLGMMVDLSHVSHNVMNQAIVASRAPVIFSHSSAYAIRKHNRNVPDDTLELVKSNKGIVMVNFYSGFVHVNQSLATIDTVIDHIEHIVNIAGLQSVGIGGDYDGVGNMPQGLEDVSKYPDLFDRLQQRNSARWTNENLKLLAGENFLRVFSEVERVRDSLRNEQPNQMWIDRQDLDAVDDINLWKCRTLLNNKSPEDDNEGNGGNGDDGGASSFQIMNLLAFLCVLLLRSIF